MPLFTQSLPVAGGTITGNLTVAGSATVGGVSVPPNSWRPSDQNLTTWAFDPANASSASNPTGGVVNLVQLILRTAATINNIIVEVATAGSVLTSGQNFLGLYDSSGTRQGVTADQTTAWASTGIMTTALVTPYAAAAGKYFVAILSNGTTTPQFARATGITGTSGLVNTGLAVSTARFGLNGSAQTSLPSSITMSSNTFASTAFWAGLS